MNRKRFSTRHHSLLNDVMGLYLSQSRLYASALDGYNLDHERLANQNLVFRNFNQSRR